MSDLFPGFETQRIAVSHAAAEKLFLTVRTGGRGPALLLVHGYPQTGAMWHGIASELAQHFTVVCPDLRGYGASEKPQGGGDHSAYAKRTMAADLAALMTVLGHDSFAVAGHDRGARVTHRLCLDHPERVVRAAVLDIIPTRELYRTANHGVAQAYYHWYFLTQPAPLPERLIGANPLFYFKSLTGSLGGSGTDPFHADARAEYEAAFANPETVHATCEDYRAGASIDLEHDAADLEQKIACPLMVMWGTKAPMHAHYDVPATWAERATQIVEAPIEAGHFLVEESPETVLPALLNWFRA